MATPNTNPIDLLAQRRALPTHLSSEEARARLSVAARRAAVWSARTTHARYVQALRDAVRRMLEGGRDNDYANIRAELRELIVAFGYTPETGFPGDAALGIPPAAPGSLRDLSSLKRVEFILDTQMTIARAAGQKARGLDPDVLKSYPYWELLRVESRRVPRGSAKSPSFGWQKRWMISGGPVLASGRLVAHKLDPVWDRLGDSRIFDDGMDLNTPPFCFRSGMGWKSLGIAAGLALGVPNPEKRPPTLTPETTLPEPKASTKSLDPEVKRALMAVLDAEEGKEPGEIRAARKMREATDAAKAAYEAQRNFAEDVAGTIGGAA